MLSNFRGIFGTYTPLTDVNGVIYPNWEYIGMYIIYGICLIFILRFLLSLFK